jgi:hypothetical protein
MKSNIMHNIFQHIKITKEEYQVMLQYTPTEKFQYLIDIFQSQHDLLSALETKNFSKTLNEFFEELIPDTDSSDDGRSYYEVNSDDIADSKNRVDILIDDDNVLVESNSLKAMRHIIYNFFDNGYILQRDLATEKLFRKDKLTRYLRVYSIIGINTVICPN